MYTEALGTTGIQGEQYCGRQQHHIQFVMDSANVIRNISWIPICVKIKYGGGECLISANEKKYFLVLIYPL